jgi:exonuclease III
MQYNADGLSTKVPELKIRLREEDIDICMIQETKLRPDNNTPRMEGYTSFRSDRKSQKGGPGS